MCFSNGLTDLSRKSNSFQAFRMVNSDTDHYRFSIWPRSRFKDWFRLLTDPDPEELKRMMHVGQMVSWPKVCMASLLCLRGTDVCFSLAPHD